MEAFDAFWELPGLAGGDTPAYSTDFDGAAGAVGNGWLGAGLLDGSGNLYINPTLSAELLTNPAFATWTGDNPDGWAVTGEVGADPSVSEVADGEAHADAPTAGGAHCNMYNSATAGQPKIQQNSKLTVGRIVRVDTVVNRVVSGSIRVSDNGAGNLSVYSTAGTKIKTYRPLGVHFQILCPVAPSDATLTSVSVKTLSDMVAYRAFAQAYGKITVPFTRIVDTCFGVILNYTDANNYGAVYCDSGNIVYGKMVAGTWTQIGAYAYTYSAGADLVVTRHQDGTVDITYNGTALVAGATASGLTAKNHGVFSTYVGNLAASFAYTPVGVS